MRSAVIRYAVKGLIWQSHSPLSQRAELRCRSVLPWECGRWYLGICWCCLPGCGWIFEPRHSPKCESVEENKKSHNNSMIYVLVKTCKITTTTTKRDLMLHSDTDGSTCKEFMDLKEEEQQLLLLTTNHRRCMCRWNSLPALIMPR